MKEAKGSDLKPDGWWDTNPEYLTRLVQKGSADYLFEYLITELLPSGIVLTARSIGKRKADRLSCSAIAWGVKEKGMFNKGTYISRLINNDVL